MAFVHHESQECTKSELDLFTIPATKHLSRRANGLSIAPRVTSLIALRLGLTYLDLEKNIRFGKNPAVCKGQDHLSNGTDLDAATKVGPVKREFFIFPVFASGWFSEPSDLSPHRPGLTHIVPWLKRCWTTEKTLNQVNYLWLCFTKIQCTPGKMDPMTEGDDANKGLNARYAFTKESTVDMMDLIHAIFSFKTVQF